MAVILENKIPRYRVFNIPGRSEAVHLAPRGTTGARSAPIEVDPVHGLGMEVAEALRAVPKELAVHTVE